MNQRGYEITRLFAKKFDILSPRWWKIQPHRKQPYAFVTDQTVNFTYSAPKKYIINISCTKKGSWRCLGEEGAGPQPRGVFDAAAATVRLGERGGAKGVYGG